VNAVAWRPESLTLPDIMDSLGHCPRRGPSVKRRGLALLVLIGALALLGSGCATTESGRESSLPGPESYLAYQSGYGYAPFEPYWWGDPFWWGGLPWPYPLYPYYYYSDGGGCGGKPCSGGHRKGHSYPRRPVARLGEASRPAPGLTARATEPGVHALPAPRAPATVEIRPAAPEGFHGSPGFHGFEGFHGSAPAAHGIR
jgi:hypothetical protein